MRKKRQCHYKEKRVENEKGIIIAKAWFIVNKKCLWNFQPVDKTWELHVEYSQENLKDEKALGMKRRCFKNVTLICKGVLKMLCAWQCPWAQMNKKENTQQTKQQQKEFQTDS